MVHHGILRSMEIAESDMSQDRLMLMRKVGAYNKAVALQAAFLAGPDQELRRSCCVLHHFGNPMHPGGDTG